MRLTAAKSHSNQQVTVRDEAIAIDTDHLSGGGDGRKRQIGRGGDQAVDHHRVTRANGHRGRNRQADPAGRNINAAAGKTKAGLLMSKLQSRDDPPAGVGAPLDRCLCHLEHPPSFS